MKATTIEKAIRETLWNYTTDDGSFPFRDQTVVGVMEAGLRQALHSRTTVSSGFAADEMPAIQIKCDSSPAATSQNTTNEQNIVRKVLIQVVNRSADINEAVEDAEHIRNYIRGVLQKQVCFVDGQERQRDLLSTQCRTLGGVGMIVKEVLPIPYQPFQVDRKFWIAVLGLEVSVYYIEEY